MIGKYISIHGKHYFRLQDSTVSEGISAGLCDCCVTVLLSLYLNLNLISLLWVSVQCTVFTWFRNRKMSMTLSALFHFTTNLNLRCHITLFEWWIHNLSQINLILLTKVNKYMLSHWTHTCSYRTQPVWPGWPALITQQVYEKAASVSESDVGGKWLIRCMLAIF